MSTAIELTPAGKARKQRFCYLDDRPTVDEPALLTLHVAGVESDYWLRPVPSEFGEAFRLEKLIPKADCPPERGDVYHVKLESEFAALCECKGFLHYGRCKHVQCIKALREAGRL